MKYDSLPDMMGTLYGIHSKNAVEIVELFEDLLDEYGMMVPDDDRRGDEGEAPIYGCTWANLVDDIAYFLEQHYGEVEPK